jgi:hypothetical protein
MLDCLYTLRGASNFISGRRSGSIPVVSIRREEKLRIMH